MAQRQRSTVGPQARTSESQLAALDGPSSSTSSPHLDPAPKHPLNLSPSTIQLQLRPTSATRRRRRPEEEATGNIESEASYSNKGKDRSDSSKPTALDKLEGWLGLSTGESSTSPLGGVYNIHNQQPPIPRSQKPFSTSRTTKLVIVHRVTLLDTLESLALRFNTDVRTLRRANGLWPGDSVQVRKEVYIPVEEGSAYDQNGISQANEGLDGKLRLLNSMTSNQSNGHFTNHRSMSGTSASSTSAVSQSQSQSGQGIVENQEVRRMTTESLSHFPPPGCNVIGKGKAKNEEAFGFGEGLRPGWDVDHGETGVDDLLQLAEKARSRGSSPSRGTETAKPIQRHRTPPLESPQISPSSSSRALEEPWKPNKWTFGQKKSSKPSSSALSPEVNTVSLSDERSKGPAMMSSASYQGWNDIPEPPLERTAKGQVAHAYKGSSRQRLYPRPGIVDLASPGTIMEDLATGLLPNAGPASNWARPIADSVPLPGDASKDARSGGYRSANWQASGLGWGQILSDTVRGKMGLEEVLERGLEDIRSLTGNTGSLTSNGTARRAMLIHAQTSLTPPARPSAELARVTLAEGQSLKPNETTLTTNGIEIRRSSGRSMHELEDLAAADEATGDDWSSTWMKPTATSSTESNRRGRKNIRNVDWLG